MNTLTEFFLSSVQIAHESLECITDPYSRASAAARLAAAIAATGVVREPDAATVVASEPAAKRSRKKSEEAKPETAEVAAPGPAAFDPNHLPDQWTDEALVYFAAELKAIEDAAKEYPEGIVHEWTKAFSNGVLENYADITPQNFQAFYAFLTQEPAEEAQTA